MFIFLIYSQFNFIKVNFICVFSICFIGGVCLSSSIEDLLKFFEDVLGEHGGEEYADLLRRLFNAFLAGGKFGVKDEISKLIEDLVGELDVSSS